MTNETMNWRILASVNIFGGFLVTQHMMAMYKKKDT